MGGDGPLVAVGVGDAGEAVARGLVGEMDPGRVKRFTIESSILPPRMKSRGAVCNHSSGSQGIPGGCVAGTASITIEVDEATARAFERHRQRYAAVFWNETPHAQRDCVARIVAVRHSVLLK